MSCHRSVASLSLLLVLSAGCEQDRPTIAGPEFAARTQRSVSGQVVPFQTSSYSFRVTAVVPEPGCNATGESRRYLSGEGTASGKSGPRLSRSSLVSQRNQGIDSPLCRERAAEGPSAA